MLSCAFIFSCYASSNRPWRKTIFLFGFTRQRKVTGGCHFPLLPHFLRFTPALMEKFSSIDGEVLQDCWRISPALVEKISQAAGESWETQPTDTEAVVNSFNLHRFASRLAACAISRAWECSHGNTIPKTADLSAPPAFSLRR